MYMCLDDFMSRVSGDLSFYRSAYDIATSLPLYPILFRGFTSQICLVNVVELMSWLSIRCHNFPFPTSSWIKELRRRDFEFTSSFLLVCES